MIIFDWDYEIFCDIDIALFLLIAPDIYIPVCNFVAITYFFFMSQKDQKSLSLYNLVLLIKVIQGRKLRSIIIIIIIIIRITPNETWANRTNLTKIGDTKPIIFIIIIIIK